MKKILTALLCLLLVSALMLPAAAAPEVVFTTDSRFAPGATVTVDIMAMTDMDATIYSAWLEGDVVYHWYVDGEENPELNGKSITLWQDFNGRNVHVAVVCYDLTVTSQSFLVTDAVAPTPAPSPAPTTQPTSAPTTPSVPNTPTGESTGGSPLWLWICIAAAVGGTLFAAGFLLGKKKT